MSKIPTKMTTNGISENKSQLIELICDHLLSICCSRLMQYSLIVTSSSIIPRKVKNGLIIERTDLSTSHEEADVTIVQQAYQFIIDVSIKSIYVIYDNTNIFVLFAYFYQKLDLQANVFIQATSGEQSIVDIDFTVKVNKEIIPGILAAHAASGCDTVAIYPGAGKASLVKKLRMG